MFARTGTPLVAVRRGVVLETGNDGGRGNYVAIFSPDSGRTYVYLHMNEPSRVQPGGRVSAGAARGQRGLHRLLLRRSPALRGPPRPRHRGPRREPAARAAALGGEQPRPSATLPPGAH